MSEHASNLHLLQLCQSGPTCLSYPILLERDRTVLLWWALIFDINCHNEGRNCIVLHDVYKHYKTYHISTAYQY